MTTIDTPPAPDDSFSEPTRRVFACDAGNTRVKIGLFAVNRRSLELPECLFHAACAATDELPWSELTRRLHEPIDDTVCCLTGSNPDTVGRIRQDWARQMPENPLQTLCDITDLLPIRVKTPVKVGTDRLLNAIAANVIRGPDQPVVIIDSGTATTVDLVDEQGAFRGGAILPGFELAAKSLHEYTALLPLVTIENLAEESRDSVGEDTMGAIRSGLFWGHVGAVRELLARFETTTAPATPLVLLTGGGALLLAPEFLKAKWEPHLSLQGLALAAIHTMRSAS